MAKKRQKAGRPKKPDTDRRDDDVRVRVTVQERELLHAAAQRRGLDFSAWARMELLRLAQDKAV